MIVLLPRHNSTSGAKGRGGQRKNEVAKELYSAHTKYEQTN